jgi:glycosyltransferase involved in cell wall biosynthesis
MTGASLVSVVMPFHNTPPAFMQEAIDSVLCQTYPAWELLLVDDGSATEATTLARAYADQAPDRIHYLEHPGHTRNGSSATRQLGIEQARGHYIALLDSDDAWLPHKLEQQVALLDAQPEAGMLYGNTLYWYSWTGQPADSRRDFSFRLGVSPGRLYSPPVLLSLFLAGKATVPCTCSVLVRRTVVEQTGGFEARFRGNCDDQAFFAKLCLAAPAFVAGECWDKYRQHPGSMTAVSTRQGQIDRDFLVFLEWLEAYLTQQQITDVSLRRALRRQLWSYGHLRGSGTPASTQRRWRRAKKWILRLEAGLLPERLRQWIWLRES